MESIAKMAPKKILITSDTLGGVFVFASDLAKGLSEIGVAIIFAAIGPELSIDQKNKLKNIKGLSLYEKEFKLEWMDNPWEDVQQSDFWIAEIESHTKPDVIHLNCFIPGTSCKAPILMTGHSCVISWHEAVLGISNRPEYLDKYYENISHAIKNAKTFISPSSTMLDKFLSIYQIPGKSIIIYNGRPLFSNSEKKENFIIGLGRIWDPAKNLILLDVASDKVNWPVCIAGQNIPAEGSNKASDFKSNYLGNLSEDAVKRCLSKASIFVSPAKYEPFGLSVLEAAMSGCALVLSDIPTFRELWHDAARFINPDSVDSLVSNVNELIQNQSEREKLAELAVARSKKVFAQVDD